LFIVVLVIRLKVEKVIFNMVIGKNMKRLRTMKKVRVLIFSY